MAIDYRELLRKYMNHVGREEGVKRGYSGCSGGLADSEGRIHSHNQLCVDQYRHDHDIDPNA